jgi:hypothetical protein
MRSRRVKECHIFFDHRIQLFFAQDKYVIWIPLNYLVIESLEVFRRYFGDEFKVECPKGSGQVWLTRLIVPL